MRHHTAARKGEAGGWHYVSLSDRGGYALGYCASHEPHATALEARECYSKYQRDNIRLDNILGDWTGCKVCDQPTKKAASIRFDGYHIAPLCDEHLTCERATEALGLNAPAGDSWQS